MLLIGACKPLRPEKEFLPEAFEKHFVVNYFGIINGINAPLPLLHQRRSGHVVTVASVSGYLGPPLAASWNT